MEIQLDRDSWRDRPRAAGNGCKPELFGKALRRVYAVSADEEMPAAIDAAMRKLRDLQ